MLLVIDGDCGFCRRSARWLQRRLPPETRVEPWQRLNLDALQLTPSQVHAALWWIDDSRDYPTDKHKDHNPNSYLNDCQDGLDSPNNQVNTTYLNATQVTAPTPVCGHEAIAGALVAIGGGWAVIGKLMLRPPLRWIARLVYAFVARNRHHLPGCSKSCELRSTDTPTNSNAPTTRNKPTTKTAHR